MKTKKPNPVPVWFVEYTCAGEWYPLGVELSRKQALETAREARADFKKYRADWNQGRPYRERLRTIRYRVRQAVAR